MIDPLVSALPKPRDTHPNVVEMVARGAERPPWHALYRLAIGYCLVPLSTWWYGRSVSGWRLLWLFLLVLLMLRLVPAVVRRLVPLSKELQRDWARQRLLAKQFDSYQWRKLVWFGLGLATHLALVGRVDIVAGGLAGACLVAGGLGTLRWRHLTRSEPIVAVLAPGGSRSDPTE